ncbi:MAG: MBL fold metallo-hydrolase [Chloroflexi bacterium]|nr:MBL fold metallo-hydrolase [Chloroflexota bacterium]
MTAPRYWHHTDFPFHRALTQIGCYWEEGRGHTEMYLIRGERLGLIDTGVASTPAEYIEPALRSMGLSLRDVEVVINSHGHHDHAGGNDAVHRAAQCEIWIHRDDAPIARDPDAAFDLFFARNLSLVGRASRLEQARVAHRVTAGQPAPIARELVDGDVLDFGRGIAFRVVHTPGHTRGCITLHWEAEGIAISEDSALGRGSRPGGMPLIFYPDLYRSSLQRIEGLRPRVLCLGHHYLTLRQTRESIRYGDLVAAFLRESAEIQEHIEAAMDRALLALGTGAPFEQLARGALRHLEEEMDLAAGPDGWPNGAIGALSSAWAARTGALIAGH